MTTLILAYLINAAWIVPVLASCAWLLERVTRPAPRGRQVLWAGCLLLATLAPATRLSAPEIRQAAVQIGPVAVAEQGHPPFRMAADLPIGRPTAAAATALAALALLIAATKLVIGLSGARALAGRSRPVTLPRPVVDAVEAFAKAAGVRAPTLRCCPGMGGPAVIGWRAPIVLLPPSFEVLAPEEMLAALLHEVAHVIRRDYVINLALEVASLPLAWHPAAQVVKARLRTAREMACDQLASAGMPTPRRYAECLVAIAERYGAAKTPLGSVGMTLSGRGDLESRVRHLVSPLERSRESGWMSALAVGALVAGLGLPALMLRITPQLASLSSGMIRLHPTPPLGAAGPGAVRLAQREAGARPGPSSRAHRPVLRVPEASRRSAHRARASYAPSRLMSAEWPEPESTTLKPLRSPLADEESQPWVLGVAARSWLTSCIRPTAPDPEISTSQRPTPVSDRSPSGSEEPLPPDVAVVALMWLTGLPQSPAATAPQTEPTPTSSIDCTTQLVRPTIT